MISKKTLMRLDNSLVIKINQMQVHYLSKIENCKSKKTNNAAKIFQKQKLEPYLEFVNSNT